MSLIVIDDPPPPALPSRWHPIRRRRELRRRAALRSAVMAYYLDPNRPAVFSSGWVTDDAMSESA